MRDLFRPTRPGARGFTLTELLVVMAVISILSVVTLVSMRALSRDARLASAVNSVTASLANARALAIKENRVVLLVFQPRLEGYRDVVVRLVPCHWTGESYLNAQAGATNVIDRFVEIPDAPVRTLPAGIKVAAPWYAADTAGNPSDDTWTTQAHLPLTQISQEVAGSLIGVMYGPDGATISGNSQSDSDLIWADLVRESGTANLNEFDSTPDPPTIRLESLNADPYLPGDVPAVPGAFEQVFPNDEPFVRIAPFIAVYDDDEARERSSGAQGLPPWNDPVKYTEELTGPTGYISTAGRRIHFNVYTGVAMK